MTDRADQISDRLPTTYEEGRARLRRVAAARELATEAHPIEARGPNGEELTIDVARIGPGDAARLLVVLSGVHGVEGFIGSALQSDLIDRLDPQTLPPDVGVLVVHAVNPWGMAWSRRQNESNVDLNRNWRRSETAPTHNDAYDEIHHVACPSTPTMPDVDELLATAAQIVDERGLAWVRDAITAGQYRHPDGLHFGGERTEQSNRILEQIARDHIVTSERALILDLHGPRGTITLLSDQPPGSPQDEFLRRHLAGIVIEATVGDPTATTGPKSGQIANGIRALFAEGMCWSTTAEVGTASDLEQLAATYQAHWVHLHGDRDDPQHAAAIDAYRSCFTPDDSEWERAALTEGRTLLDRTVAAVIHWDDDNH